MKKFKVMATFFFVSEKKKKMTTQQCHRLFLWWCFSKEGDNSLLPFFFSGVETKKATIT